MFERESGCGSAEMGCESVMIPLDVGISGKGICVRGI